MSAPLTVQDIDVEWLGRALGADLDGVEVHPIAAGEGFMGQLARVSIASADPAVPCSVIVKLPTAEPGARAMGEMMRVWEREHCFYRDVAADLTIRVPRAYVNTLDPPCLVLEELAPAVAGDHLAGATRDQAERSIDTLLPPPCSLVRAPVAGGVRWMPGIDDPSVLGFGPCSTRAGQASSIATATSCRTGAFGGASSSSSATPAWIEGHLDDAVTLVHGDFRLDNLFFAADGSVAVIDWQLSMRAPGQTDLVYFCANNLTVPARRELENDLIDRYVAGLHRAGVPADRVTADAVRRGYIEGMLFCAASFGASLLTIDPANERGAALFDQLARRTFAAVDDLDSGTLMGL